MSKQQIENCKCCCRHSAIEDGVLTSSSYHNVKSLVDHRSPIVKIETYLSKKANDFIRIKKIAHENEKLLTKIIECQRHKGKIDTNNSVCGQKSAYIARNMKRIARIEAENFDIHRKLQSVQSTPILNNHELAKCWRKNLEEIRFKSRYPYNDRSLCGTNRPPECDAAWICLTHCPSGPRTRINFNFVLQNSGHSLGIVKMLLFDDLQSEIVGDFLSNIANMEECASFSSDDCNGSAGVEILRIYPNVYAEFNMTSTSNSHVDDGNNSGALPLNYTGTLALLPGDNRDRRQMMSKYILTLKSLPVLNGSCLVLGRLIAGWNVLQRMQTLTRRNGCPKQRIFMTRIPS